MKEKKFKLMTFITVSALLIANSLWAQPEGDLAANFLGDLFIKMFAAIVVITLLFALVTFIRISFMMMDQAKAKVYGEAGTELPAAKTQKKSLYDKMMQWMTKTVPLEREHDVLLDHDYDGIKELDNKLPPWWLAMFYISIIFSIGYMGYYHFSDQGKSILEVYEEEMAEAEYAQIRYLERIADKVNERSVISLTNEADLANGSRIFLQNCATCHGAGGEGGVGPNLTDDYWINGKGGIKDLFKVIKYGVPANGMTAWEKQMGPKQIQEVASFVKTLHGTSPPNPKAPQGELVTPEN